MERKLRFFKALFEKWGSSFKANFWLRNISMQFFLQALYAFYQVAFPRSCGIFDLLSFIRWKSPFLLLLFLHSQGSFVKYFFGASRIFLTLLFLPNLYFLCYIERQWIFFVIQNTYNYNVMYWVCRCICTDKIIYRIH